MSKNKIISTPQVADPKDVKVGLVSALSAIFVLMILLFLITYQIADPPAQDVVVTAEAVIDEILLKDLKLESGSIGGGSPSNDRVDKPKEQIQEIITGKSKRSYIKTGKSNKTNGNDANNEASTTVQSQDPFGSGGPPGDVPFGRPPGDDFEPNPKDGQKRKIKISVKLDKTIYDNEYDCNICFKVTINENGDVVNAKAERKNTTCMDPLLINQVVIEVMQQLKYNKKKGAGLEYNFYTIKINGT